MSGPDETLTRLALLERDLGTQAKNQEDFINRFDKTLDKLTEFTEKLKDLLITHDNILNNQSLKITSIYQDVDRDITELKKSNERIETRLAKMEKWLWIASGVIMVMSVLIQKINLINLFS